MNFKLNEVMETLLPCSACVHHLPLQPSATQPPAHPPSLTRSLRPEPEPEPEPEPQLQTLSKQNHTHCRPQFFRTRPSLFVHELHIEQYPRIQWPLAGRNNVNIRGQVLAESCTRAEDTDGGASRVNE